MKKLAYIGCLGMIGIITTEFGIIGILPQVAAHYRISIDQAGILLSAFALVIAFTGPLMTLLFSGFDRKKVMLLAIGLFVLTGSVSAFAPPFWLLLLVRILPAFLQPVFISTAISVAVAAADKKNEHRMISIILGGISIATVTTVPLGTWIAGRFNWQLSFAMQAVISLIALLGILLVLPAMPVKERRSYGTQLKILGRADFLLASTINFLVVAAWFSTYSYFADYLGKEKHMDEQQISMMMLLFGITSVIGNWLAGKIFGKNMVLTTAVFLSGTIIIPFALYYCGYSSWPLMLVIALWGFLYGPVFFTGAANMISAAPDALEFANSLAVSFGNLGVSIGTAVSGMVIATHSVAYAPWVGMAFGLAALVMVVVRSAVSNRAADVVCMAQ